MFLLLPTVSGGLSGCGSSRVVFVPESDGLVRLGDDVRGHVYYWDGSNWVRSASSVYLPEGWYAGSIDGDVEEANLEKARSWFQKAERGGSMEAAAFLVKIKELSGSAE